MRGWPRGPVGREAAWQEVWRCAGAGDCGQTRRSRRDVRRRLLRGACAKAGFKALGRILLLHRSQALGAKALARLAVQTLRVGLLGALKRSGTARGLVFYLRQRGAASQQKSSHSKGKKRGAHNVSFLQPKPPPNNVRPCFRFAPAPTILKPRIACAPCSPRQRRRGAVNAGDTAATGLSKSCGLGSPAIILEQSSSSFPANI
jgi:hypothetical protein